MVGVSMAALVVFIALTQEERRAGGADAARGGWRATSGRTLLGVYGGFFSGGYTTLMTVLCTVCFGLTMMESVAVTKPVNLLSCAAASVVFFAGGLIDLRIGVPLAAANLAGGWLGAHAALKGGDRFVRLLFLLTVARAGRQAAGLGPAPAPLTSEDPLHQEVLQLRRPSRTAWISTRPARRSGR